AYAPGAQVAERTHALRIDRVGKHVQSTELQEECDVIDEGQRELATAKIARQGRLGTILYPLGPGRTLPGPLPAQEVLEGPACSRALVEESHAVEVVGRGSLVSRSAVQ